MKTIREIFFLGKAHLEKVNIEQPKQSMERILMHHLCLTRLELYMDFDRPLKEDEVSAVRKSLARRSRGEPVAYIEGETTFLGCQIALSKEALIPRPETEWIVERIINELKDQDLKGKTLFDIGTGTGCIAIALKKHLPELELYASDITLLPLAVENAKANDVQITFLEGDLLDPFPPQPDFIVANLPYIATEEPLSREVRDFEPHRALFSGPDGLDHYRRLKAQLPKSTFKLWLEIGMAQGAAIQEIFGKGNLLSDYGGKDRLFSLENAPVKEVL